MTRVGVAFQGDKRLGEYGRLGALVERFDVDVISVYGDLGYQHPLPALLEMAAVTTRAMLGPACLNPYTMHPYEIAGFVAALDIATDGRSYLGLARGAWLGELGIEQTDAPQRVAETWEVVRRLLAGDRTEFEGRHFSLGSGAALRYPVKRSVVPLLVGGWGPRMLAMAGQIADEVKVGGSASPAMAAVAKRRIAVGEAEAGRRVGSTGLVMGAVTVVDQDRSAARRRARREVAMYIDVVADLDPTVSVDPGSLEHIRTALEAGDHEAAGAGVSDADLDRFAFSGSPEDVLAQSAALFDAGASRVEFGTPHGLHPETGLELLGTKVIPSLRSRT